MPPISPHVLSDSAEIRRDGTLWIAGCDALALAEEFGTPLFVYDEQHIRNRCREAVAAFGSRAIYASKAFLCKAIARIVHEEGMGIDVASGGEMHVALSAGVPAGALTFHGNNKSMAELTAAVRARVGTIVVDSLDEFDRLERVVDPATPQRVLLRITPGVEAHTHEYISTGQDDSKFGFTVSSGAAAKAVDRALEIPGVDLVGVHCHIGSQVFRVESFAKALSVIAQFARPYRFEQLVVGGGLGVAYLSDEHAPTITEWANVIREAAHELDIRASIGIEPGRAIIAAAAMTLYTVGTIKDLPGIRTYVAVDGGISDNPRPVLYGSGYDTFLPSRANADRQMAIRLVGKHCESGDIVVREGWVPEDLVVGDIIATPVTGAYGLSMASNYNKVPRPAVVLVNDGESRVIVRRETYDDLLATDVG